MFTNYPRVNVVDIKEELFSIDKDILDLQNVIYPNVADKYTSPLLKMIAVMIQRFYLVRVLDGKLLAAFMLMKK